MKRPTVLDTFAGAGGFSLGFEQAGFKIIGAIEKDAWAVDTFKSNHPDVNVLKGSIESFTDLELQTKFTESNIDVVIGGPPCQGYSICNANSGDPKDPRNTLFREFLRVGRIFSPKFMVMENVPNILKAKTHNGSLVSDIIKTELESMGYNVYMKILQASDYGVPQMRKRFFVIASKHSLKNPFPNPIYSNGGTDDDIFALPKCPTLWDAISDLPVVGPCEGAELLPYTLPFVNDYQKQLRKNSTYVHNHLSMKHTPRMVKRFESMQWGDSSSNVSDELKPRKRNSMEISDKIYDQNNRRMFPDKICHTLPASFYANFVHPYLNRNFTAREGARIQSFPDTYVFKGKPTVLSKMLLAREGRHDENYLCQYNQIGNAVPPLLAKAIASHLLT